MRLTHQTAVTEFVEADGVSYAYRRFGDPADVPLVLLAHYRGNLDGWDPALTDALAVSREIVLVDAPGVGASTGAPNHAVPETAQAIIAFLDALGLREIDLLGFSLGGFVAQEIALIRPWSVRRLILVGTGPRGAPGMHGLPAEAEEHARHDETSGDDLLHIFFAHTQTSQAKGKGFLARLTRRSVDRDPTPTLEVREAQYDAMLEWGGPDHAALQRLTAITSPTLILQGDDDLMIPTKVSYLMAGLIPHAQLRIYPDAGHASIFQYPEDAARDINAFLDNPAPGRPGPSHQRLAAPSDGRRSRARDGASESANALALDPYSPLPDRSADVPGHSPRQTCGRASHERHRTVERCDEGRTVEP